ncbi:MAG: ribosome recycling factor [Bacteroidetes bacterium]|nr:MAG: ribosome recycling factor [Bacteroidota bacterium]
MLDDCQFVYDFAQEGMEKALEHLEKDFQKIRAGKATPDMLNGVIVDYYGTMTPISQTANVSTPDPRQIIVQPWDKSIIGLLEKAIIDANLGLNPQNEGEILRIKVPVVTEERRKELVKKAKSEAESSKIGVRNVRRSANDEAKKLEKDSVPEDDVKKLQDEIQKLTNGFIEKIDKIFEAKEKDIMTI